MYIFTSRRKRELKRNRVKTVKKNTIRDIHINEKHTDLADIL